MLIGKVINNEKGIVMSSGVLFLSLCISLAVLMSTAYGFMMYMANRTVREVRDTTSQIVSASVQKNSYVTYSSKRDTLTGAYEPITKNDILVELTAEEIEEMLVYMLGLNNAEDKALGVYKEEEGKPIYYITGVTVKTVNPPVNDSTQTVYSEVIVNLKIPFGIGGYVNTGYMIELDITVSAQDVMKY